MEKWGVHSGSDMTLLKIKLEIEKKRWVRENIFSN